MASTATYQCKECKKPFEARTTDRARGWALFCSKSCKAVKQTKRRDRKSSYPRHDGRSPMKFKVCACCGEAAVNGIYTITGIEWLCQHHLDDNEHPFSGDGLGQW